MADPKQTEGTTGQAAATAAAHWHPSHNPWLIAVSVMAATFMEILDTSVANVALPHIAGNLSATTEFTIDKATLKRKRGEVTHERRRDIARRVIKGLAIAGL